MRYFATTFALLPLLAAAQLSTNTTLQNGPTVTHESRIPALFVKKASPSAAGLTPGAFTTTWTGKLKIEQRARLIFSFEGQGKASLNVDGKDALSIEGDLNTKKSALLRLNPGEIPVTITYTSPADGSGEFRLYWEGRDFAREVVPPTAFIKIKKRAAVDPIHLIAAHNCIKCHLADDVLGSSHVVPELSHDAPDLTNIGERRQPEWLTRWIAQPDKLKPGTTMPALVDHTTAEGSQQAADIAAYLASLKEKEPAKALEIPADLAEKGGVHFHNLGCVACHTLPEVSEIDHKYDRIPLNNVATKYTPGNLEIFLKKPAAHWKSIKMPDFRFSDDEAKELAAYLSKEATGRHTPDPSEFAPGDVKRGEELVKSLHCANCHQGLPAAEPNPAPAFAALAKLTKWDEKGCLAPSEKRGQAPRLILSPAEKEALAAPSKFLPELSHDTPAAYAERQFHALRCIACHDRDSETSYLALLHPESNKLVEHVEGQQEKLEQTRPLLTSIGAMLNTPYFKGMLDGSIEPRPRPWLDMRMPAFHQHAELLPAGFAAQHGLDIADPDASPTDAEAAKTGAEIISLKGYACVTCHAVGDTKPLAAFEVLGINFDQTHRRLRPAYFHRWLQNPYRVVPDTKMPKYTQPDGAGLRNDILDGDSKKQFDAIWEYFKTLDKSKP